MKTITLHSLSKVRDCVFKALHPSSEVSEEPVNVTEDNV